SRLSVQDIKDLIYYMFTTYEDQPGQLYLFLDEIQEITDWESLIRNLIDDTRFNVMITGSSSKLLSQEISTRLRGRTLSYILTPLSFPEFLRVKDFNMSKIVSTDQVNRIQNLLLEYIEYGGYPEVALFGSERIRILNEILNLAIERDILERYGFRNSHILKLLILNISVSSIFSINKFYRYAKNQSYEVSKDTLYSYISALEDNNIIYSMHNFNTSPIKSKKTLAKYYFVDNGLLRVSGNTDISKKMENAVYMNLFRTYGKERISYYITKNGKEVDFLINNSPIRLINVAFSLENPATREREIKGLLEASSEIGECELELVTMNEEGLDHNISIVPLWKFLMG
ncbi:MAG: ATP-binding protein, partial [Thermoplasmataceae archaeon]